MHKSLIAIAVGASLALAGCGETETKPAASADKAEAKVETVAADNKVTTKEKKVVAANAENNPLLVKSSLQYEAPEYDKIKLEHYIPAFKQGIKEQAAEIDAIANNAEAATFDNTIVAMEKTGALLTRVSGAFFNIAGTISDDTVRAIQSEVVPLLTAHGDNINLNPALFKRVEAVYQGIDKLKGEDKRLTELTYKRFVRAGAKLDDAQKAKVREINGELAKLTNEFGQNLMKVSKDAAVVVEDKAQLAGLSDSKIASLAAAAEAADMKGKYLITLQNTTRQSIMNSLENRELREKIWQASANRGMDVNGPLAIRLAELRANKAQLMGYPNWAAYVLDNQMAKTPAAVLKMLDDMAPKIVAKNELEAAELKALMKANGVTHDLKPWDWTYYAEKVRAAKYDLDESEVRNYFEINNVLEKGIFYALERQFGITFKERNDLPTYHPDVRTFEVFDADGSSIGLFYADYFAREGKRGGAWMNAFVSQNKLLNKKPVIVNVMNIPKPAEGEPALVSFDNVTTMFHEMGHGIHGLFSDVKYPSLAGTAVSRDYVEFPSQFQEDWAINPEVLASYAKHYKTGEAIPQELLAKMLKANKFNQGFDSLEYVAAALLDMEWHSIAPGTKVESLTDFEDKALAAHGVKSDYVPPRYKSNYFAHVFAGGYSAGYYAYMWSEVLAADAFNFIAKNGGLSREYGDKIRQTIYSKGNSIDPNQQYLNFKGAKPEVEGLLLRRGLL